jgi:hypothetical protein
MVSTLGNSSDERIRELQTLITGSYVAFCKIKRVKEAQE